jgi:hypothetical protein
LIGGIGMEYYVFLENYGHTICIKTKEYNDKVKEMLEWSRAPYDVAIVVKNPESVVFDRISMLDTKEEFLEELDTQRRFSGFWEEDENEIERNIKFIESILVEQNIDFKVN